VQANHEDRTVGDLVMLHRAGMLRANPEYQRGVVWSKSQKRLNALYEFVEGGFTLLDPVKDDDEAKFPAFIKAQPCPWGGKDFDALPASLREQFLNTPLRTANIATDRPNEVRDLFVRLQSGLPLNAQETRDAWPGQFTDFILWLGGKPELPRYPGHEFFKGPMGLGGEGDRGKTRLLAAQIALLFLSRRERGADYFSDIGSSAITEFYYRNIDFDRNSANARRLCQILTKLHQLLQPGHRPRLKAHDAIHLVLLVDALWDEYTRSWEEKLPKALDRFLAEMALAKTRRDSVHPNEFWVRYGQWTRVNSDRGDRIAHRHQFYLEKMLAYMQPLQFKDPDRAFGELERTILFYRQAKRCAVCDGQVAWNEVEVHHVAGHAAGGATDLRNGAVVHAHCHRRARPRARPSPRSSWGGRCWTPPAWDWSRRRGASPAAVHPADQRQDRDAPAKTRDHIEGELGRPVLGKAVSDRHGQPDIGRQEGHHRDEAEQFSDAGGQGDSSGRADGGLIGRGPRARHPRPQPQFARIRNKDLR
jgi:hypothetical protein